MKGIVSAMKGIVSTKYDGLPSADSPRWVRGRTKASGIGLGLVCFGLAALLASCSATKARPASTVAHPSRKEIESCTTLDAATQRAPVVFHLVYGAKKTAPVDLEFVGGNQKRTRCRIVPKAQRQSVGLAHAITSPGKYRLRIYLHTKDRSTPSASAEVRVHPKVRALHFTAVVGEVSGRSAPAVGSLVIEREVDLPKGVAVERLGPVDRVGTGHFVLRNGSARTIACEGSDQACIGRFWQRRKEGWAVARTRTTRGYSPGWMKKAAVIPPGGSTLLLVQTANRTRTRLCKVGECPTFGLPAGSKHFRYVIKISLEDERANRGFVVKGALMHHVGEVSYAWTEFDAQGPSMRF